MAMELVTGYAGKAHVTSYQDAAIQAGIVGVDNGVLSYVGQGMKAVATSANNIRIYDGVALIGGKAVVIDRDTYQDVAIANGTVGKYRNDIIYIKYTKDAFTGVESVTFDVKQGAAGNSGIDPALTTNNLYSTGTLTSEIPFKRVRLNGLAIESVENMHDIVPSLSELNRKLSVCNEIYSGVANHAQYDIPDITSYDLLVIYGGPGTYANTSVVIPVASIVYKDDGQFALGVYQGSSTFWELEFNFPSNVKINIANYKNQSWTTPAIRKILGVKL